MANYTYLVNDIIQACENDSTEFAAYVPNMVYRAEERMTTDLDDYGLVSYTSVAISASNNQLTLPSGTRVVKNINFISNSSKINLLLRTDEYINDYWPVAASTSEPKYYARRNNTTVLLAPTPVSTYDATVVYVARPATLSSVSENNYFSDFCYGMLFNACMVEAMMYQKDYAALQLFEARYNALLELQRNQARRTRRDDMEAPSSPAGADDNIINKAN